MKTLLAVLLAFSTSARANIHLHQSMPSSSSSSATSIVARPDFSVHGMFVFGSGPTVFLNHLPMFMPAHAVQAIFEATFDGDGAAAYAQATGGLVTLVPEPMSLVGLIAQPHDFYGDLYDGHFERGGRKIASHIRVSVTNVVHAHEIGSALPQPDIEFGNCKAHYISKAPDFDEIWCGGKKIYREDDDLQ